MGCLGCVVLAMHLAIWTETRDGIGFLSLMIDFTLCWFSGFSTVFNTTDWRLAGWGLGLGILSLIFSSLSFWAGHFPDTKKFSLPLSMSSLATDIICLGLSGRQLYLQRSYSNQVGVGLSVVAIFFDIAFFVEPCVSSMVRKRMARRDHLE